MADPARVSPTSWAGTVTLFNGRYPLTFDVRPRGGTAEAAARRAIRLAQEQARARTPGRRRRQTFTEIRLTLTRVPAAGGACL